MRCHIVDVFAETRLAGNQLAVVRDAADLSTTEMQAIAREMNFSETTFVLSESETQARVRIFTPNRELPFAGHPTIGTAWVLRGQRDLFTLELDAGPVTVAFDVRGVAWMTPPPVDLGAGIARNVAAALVSLAPNDLHPEFEPRHATVGPHFALVGVKDLAILKAAVVNEVVRDELAEGGFLATFVFAPEAYSADADFAARMFFAAAGAREDPATGSANAAFAAYLFARGESSEPNNTIIVEQGFEVARPSRLYLEVGASIRVGGRVQPVLEGTMG